MSSPTADAATPRATAIRGGAVRVGGYTAGVLISLATASVLVRHLGISGFGRFVTVVSLVALVGGVTEAGIAVYGIREYTRQDDAARRVMIADLLGMRLSLTVAGVGCAVAFAAIAGYDGVLVIGTLVAGVGLLVQVIADVLSVPLQSALLLGRLTMVDTLRRLVALALTGVLVVVGATLLPLLAVSTGAGAVALALLTAMVRSDVTVRITVDWRRWRALLADTLPFAIAMSVGAVYFYVTIVLMSVIASAHQTGLFATSFRVTQVAMTVPTLLLTAIFPLLSRERDHVKTAVGSMIGRVLEVALTCGVWMSLALALGASFIIEVIAGARGHAAASVLRIQGIALTVTFLSATCMLALLALGRHRPMLIASSGALLLDVALGLLLIPELGARGGAIADVITEVVVVVALIVTLTRILRRNIVSASLVLRVALAASLAFAVWPLGIGSVARTILASVIYFAALALLGAIPGDVIEAARRIELPGSRHA
jgi:O-antigen/teichoic acid export membrane protein